MARHLLNDLRIRNTKPRKKPFRLADGDGLYLYVPPSGALAWQFRYRWVGKPQTTTLGKVGVMSLAAARQAAQDARIAVAKGEHLTVAKRIARVRLRANAGNTLETVTRDWMGSEAKRAGWTEGHRFRTESSLRRHLADLYSLPVSQITAPVVAPLLNRMEATVPDMAAKVRQRLRAILDFCVEQGVINGNPLPARRRHIRALPRHMPAMLDEKGIGGILRAAERTNVGAGVERAHLLLAFCAQRVGEVVGAKWDEFDLEAGLWSIPRDRMKRKDPERGPHQVPLPPNLRAAMRGWKREDRKNAVYVCPSPNGAGRHITRESVEQFYRISLKLVGKHSPHSWRSTFSTLARDAGKDSEAVEAQLDHVIGTKIQAAYDRARRLELRRTLMNWYESTLIEARDHSEGTTRNSRRPKTQPS
jgi:integrase